MSFLQKIAQERDERVKDLHLDLPVPTWDGDLVARFTVPPRNIVEKFSGKKRNTNDDMQFVIKNVVALYAKDQSATANGERMDGNADYVRIENGDGVPVLFDQQLAELLGQGGEVESAQDVLLYVFKGNTIAIGAFVGKLLVWAQDTDAKVAEALAGE